MFFPQRIWFPFFFFFFFLVWTLPGYFFLFPQAFSGTQRRRIGEMQEAVLWWFPKTWKIALPQFVLHPHPHPNRLLSIAILSSFPWIQRECFIDLEFFFSYLSFFWGGVYFFFSFLSFFTLKTFFFFLNDIHARSNAKESRCSENSSQEFLGAIFLKSKPQIPAGIIPYKMASRREPERHLYLHTSCELKRDFHNREHFTSPRKWHRVQMQTKKLQK